MPASFHLKVKNSI